MNLSLVTYRSLEASEFYLCAVLPAEFISSASNRVILDARSPSEFAEGHITGALNLPIFTDEERAEVGTCYKRNGRDQAIKLGLRLIGPQLNSKVEQAEALAPDKQVQLYCWRGGMRSGSLAWLLRLNGFDVNLLDGGYKAYRQLMYERFESSHHLVTVGGMTGTGKTEILRCLREQGEQVIDLEALAGHKGSAFGNMDNIAQPSIEQFQNLLFDELSKLDSEEIIWVEDESQHIGSVWINDQFYFQVKAAPLIFIDRTLEERTRHLADQYGEAHVDALKAIFEKISKRLGGQNVKDAHQKLEQGDLESAAAIALRYYDKSYGYMIDKRQSATIHKHDGSNCNFDQIAEQLIQRKHEFRRKEAHLI